MIDPVILNRIKLNFDSDLAVLASNRKQLYDTMISNFLKVKQEKYLVPKVLQGKVVPGQELLLKPVIFPQKIDERSKSPLDRSLLMQ